MKRGYLLEIWIIIIAVILFSAWRMKPSKGIKSISTDTLKGLLHDSDKLFIDVRTPNEFKVSNIHPFKNIPLGSNFSNLPKEKEIIVICQSGMLSVKACNQLKKLGYEKVTNVRGGMSAWKI